MATAVLLATAADERGQPVCMLRCAGEPLLRRFDGQLRHHGVAEVHVLTHPAWQNVLVAVAPRARVHATEDLAQSLALIAKLAAEGQGALLLAHAETVTLDSVLGALLADPRVSSGVLSTTRWANGAILPRLRILRGRVVAAESAYHEVGWPTHAFLGVSKISEQDRSEFVEVARTLSELVAGGPPAGWEDHFRRKVTLWSKRFFHDRVPSERVATGMLAAHLEQIGRPESWLPDPAALRGELTRQFEDEVVKPAALLRDDAVALLTTGLVRHDVVLTTTHLAEPFWYRPTTQADADAAAAAMENVEEDRLRLDAAVKEQDGFFTTFFVSPYSKYIARWCALHGITPNQVTTISMLLGALAALAFATGARAGLIGGAVLLQVSFTTDCVDGQLARYTHQFSKLGAWLDSVFDRTKEYLVYAGLAVGGAVTGADATIWLLAAAALTLQTVRHNLDFAYTAQQHQRLAISTRLPLKRSEASEEVSQAETAAPPSRLHTMGAAGVRLSGLVGTRPWMRWVKRMLVLPIGERFALISITAAVANPRVTFLALLIWGAVGATYSVTGRILRSFAW